MVTSNSIASPSFLHVRAAEFSHLMQRTAHPDQLQAVSHASSRAQVSLQTAPHASLSFPYTEAYQWTPPVIQEITLDDYETATRRDRIVDQLPFASIVEGTSTNANSGVSTSSHSDNSESEPMYKPCLSSYHNFSIRCYFLSKPIHPFFFSHWDSHYISL